jgi:hypothetical protein
VVWQTSFHSIIWTLASEQCDQKVCEKSPRMLSKITNNGALFRNDFIPVFQSTKCSQSLVPTYMWLLGENSGRAVPKF